MNNVQKVVGVTGTIGSGKTMVCHVLKELDFPVYYSDAKAKEVINSNGKVKNDLVNAFGSDVFKEGKYNVSYVKEKVWEDKEALAKLNAIVHPALKQDFLEWCLKHKECRFVVKESALLLSGEIPGIDVLVEVEAPEEQKIRRILRRDKKRSEVEIKKILSLQKEKRRVTDVNYLIINIDEEEVLVQVLKMVKQMLL